MSDDQLELGVVDVYPVGVLSDLRHFWLFRKNLPLGRRLKRLKHDARRWKSRNSWNGFLAEPRDGGGALWIRCGHGWTRRRALRDLHRHMRCLAASRVGGESGDQ